MQKNKIPIKTIGERVHALLREGIPLTHAEIVEKIEEDKAIVSGYLLSMVDHEEILMKKIGKGKFYFLNEKGK